MASEPLAVKSTAVAEIEKDIEVDGAVAASNLTPVETDCSMVGHCRRK